MGSELIDKEYIRTLIGTNRLLVELLNKQQGKVKSARNENKKKIRDLEARLAIAVEWFENRMAGCEEPPGECDYCEEVGEVLAKLKGVE